MKDVSLEDADNLQDPDMLAREREREERERERERERADNLDSTLEQFSSISEVLVDEQENIISN